MSHRAAQYKGIQLAKGKTGTTAKDVEHWKRLTRPGRNHERKVLCGVGGGTEEETGWQETTGIAGVEEGRTSDTIRGTEEEVTAKETEGPETPTRAEQTGTSPARRKTKCLGGYLKSYSPLVSQKTKPLLKHQKHEG